jgi:hypothetical protein
VDHIDRNPHNNDYKNLRYVITSEQMINCKLPENFIKKVTKNLNDSSPVKIMILLRTNDKNYSFILNQGTNSLVKEKLFSSMNSCAKFLVNYDVVSKSTIVNRLKKLHDEKLNELFVEPYEIKII